MHLPQITAPPAPRRSVLTCMVFSLLALLTATAALGQNGNNTPLRIIAFGAHPDDNELKASGVAAMWAARGHKVKFVAMTNGDIGHFKEAGGPLAARRLAEVQQCAKILGIETEVLGIHDGELEPSLENRKTVARLIRDWQADIVLFHRPYDYHPDHRYVGVLVQDAAVVVMAPFYVPNTPPTKRNPVFLYYSDPFLKPYPFEPTIVVGIDNAAQKKWDCVSAMPSQFGDEHSWQASTNPNTPKAADKRPEYLLDLFKQRNVEVANKYRNRLVELYGKEKAAKIRYAEAFELCQYGRQPSIQELLQLFPNAD
jgi:N-acetylglucosamine malate deacetylase 1